MRFVIDSSGSQLFKNFLSPVAYTERIKVDVKDGNVRFSYVDVTVCGSLVLPCIGQSRNGSVVVGNQFIKKLFNVADSTIEFESDGVMCNIKMGNVELNVGVPGDEVPEFLGVTSHSGGVGLGKEQMALLVKSLSVFKELKMIDLMDLSGEVKYGSVSHIAMVKMNEFKKLNCRVVHDFSRYIKSAGSIMKSTDEKEVIFVREGGVLSMKVGPVEFFTSVADSDFQDIHSALKAKDECTITLDNTIAVNSLMSTIDKLSLATLDMEKSIVQLIVSRDGKVEIVSMDIDNRASRGVISAKTEVSNPDSGSPSFSVNVKPLLESLNKYVDRSKVKIRCLRSIVVVCDGTNSDVILRYAV